MFNGNKFNSVTTNTGISAILIGGIGRRLPYIIELSTFIEIIGKKKFHDGKVYFNILGKKRKEQVEYVLFTVRLQEYIRTSLIINGIKKTYQHNEYDISIKKRKELAEYVLLTCKVQNYIEKTLRLNGLKRLYGENVFNILGKKCVYQLLKDIDLVSKKREENIESIFINGIKRGELNKDFNIKGDVDYTNLFFILNL